MFICPLLSILLSIEPPTLLLGGNLQGSRRLFGRRLLDHVNGLRESGQGLDGCHQHLLCKVTIPLSHSHISMAGELLRGPHGDPRIVSHEQKSCRLAMSPRAE